MRFAPHAISGERDSSATRDRRRDAKRAMGSRGREIELDDIAKYGVVTLTLVTCQ